MDEALSPHSDTILELAAEQIAEAAAVLLVAGSGLNIDSGLHDFRNEQNFWVAYPAYESLGVNFIDILNPFHFKEDPQLAWGFFGNRISFAESIQQHDGYKIIKKWLRKFKQDYFVITSNIDNQFENANYAKTKMCEVHGNMTYLQCAAPCCYTVWKGPKQYIVDEATMRCDDVPHCPQCHGNARPNILMINDFTWINQKTNAQFKKFEQFLKKYQDKKLVILEIGTGSKGSTMRSVIGKVCDDNPNAHLIRINPTPMSLMPPQLEIPLGALSALSAIDFFIRKLD